MLVYYSEKQRTKKNKVEAAEYAKLLVKRMKEAKEKYNKDTITQGRGCLSESFYF